MAAWLRQILAHNLAHAARDHGRQKRDAKREVSLAAALRTAFSAAFGTVVVPVSEMSPLILSKVASPMPSTFLMSSSDLKRPFLVR